MDLDKVERLREQRRGGGERLKFELKSLTSVLNFIKRGFVAVFDSFEDDPHIIKRGVSALSDEVTAAIVDQGRDAKAFFSAGGAFEKGSDMKAHNGHLVHGKRLVSVLRVSGCRYKSRQQPDA